MIHPTTHRVPVQEERPQAGWEIIKGVGCESRAVRRHGMRLSQLKRHLVAYVKNRAIKTALTGRDLQTVGLKPGLQYKTILGKLLGVPIDGMITTKAEELAYAQKRLALAG